MSKSRMKVLVIGATGKQGGRVARILLDRGCVVRAFTRDPNSGPARDLAEFGAEIVVGSLLDRNSLDRAIKDVDAVFAMTSPTQYVANVKGDWLKILGRGLERRLR